MTAVFARKRQPDIAGFIERVVPGVRRISTQRGVVGHSRRRGVLLQPRPQAFPECGFGRAVGEVHDPRYPRSRSLSRRSAIPVY